MLSSCNNSAPCSRARWLNPLIQHDVIRKAGIRVSNHIQVLTDSKLQLFENYNSTSWIAAFSVSSANKNAWSAQRPRGYTFTLSVRVEGEGRGWGSTTWRGVWPKDGRGPQPGGIFHNTDRLYTWGRSIHAAISTILQQLNAKGPTCWHPASNCFQHQVTKGRHRQYRAAASDGKLSLHHRKDLMIRTCHIHVACSLFVGTISSYLFIVIQRTCRHWGFQQRPFVLHKFLAPTTCCVLRH